MHLRSKGLELHQRFKTAMPPSTQRLAATESPHEPSRLGASDASLVALGERLGATRIATLDRRDFTVVRPRHAAAFELLP